MLKKGQRVKRRNPDRPIIPLTCLEGEAGAAYRELEKRTDEWFSEWFSESDIGALVMLLPKTHRPVSCSSRTSGPSERKKIDARSKDEDGTAAGSRRKTRQEGAAQA